MPNRKLIEQVKLEIEKNRREVNERQDNIRKLQSVLETLGEDSGVDEEDPDVDEEKEAEKTSAKWERCRLQKLVKFREAIRQNYQRAKKGGDYVPKHHTKVMADLNIQNETVAHAFGLGKNVTREVYVQAQILCKQAQLQRASRGFYVYVPEEKQKALKKKLEKIERLQKFVLPDFSGNQFVYQKIVQVLWKRGKDCFKVGDEFNRDDFWKECQRQGSSLKEKELPSSLNKLAQNYPWLLSRQTTRGPFTLECKSVPAEVEMKSKKAQKQLARLEKSIVWSEKS